MTTVTRTSCFRLGCLAILAFALSACSNVVQGPGGKITKLKYYHLMPFFTPNTTNQTILFERQHFIYGAVSKKEIVDRFGHYYAFFWKANDRTGPVTVKLEYQQALSGLSKHSQELVVDNIRRSNITKFQVVGPEYQKRGRVIAWRVSILRGKEELVSQQSALWN